MHEDSAVRRSILAIAAAVALLLVLFACSNTELPPIFYTLETERPLTENRNLPANITVQRIAVATTVTPNRFFIAANTLYTRLEGTATEWSAVELTNAPAGTLCNNLAAFSGSGSEILYAAFNNVSGAGEGLWSGTPGPSVTWTQVGGGLPADKQVGLIKVVDVADTPADPTDDYLFVSTNEHSLYYSNDGTTFTRVKLAGADVVGATITDVAYDGTDFWVTAGATLYAQTTAAPPTDCAAQTAAGTPTTTVSFASLHHSGVNAKLYLATKDGLLYSHPDAGSWSAATTVEVSDVPVLRFTRFAEPNPTGVVAPEHTDLFVGTESSGYFVIQQGDIAEANLLRQPEYNISALYAGAILDFLVYPPTGNTTQVFAGTAGAGLWRADYQAGNWLWVQE
jgi:hypothetical protein